MFDLLGQPHPVTINSASINWLRGPQPLEIPSVFLGRQLPPDQRHCKRAPGEGDLLDVGAGHGVDPLAHPLAAQPLVEEAGRVTELLRAFVNCKSCCRYWPCVRLSRSWDGLASRSSIGKGWQTP